MLASPYICSVEDIKLSANVKKTGTKQKNAGFSRPIAQKQNRLLEQESTFRAKTVNATVFLAVTHTILRAAIWVDDVHTKGIRIATYSQVALRAFGSPLDHSKFGPKFRNRINSVSRFNTGELLLVPGH